MEALAKIYSLPEFSAGREPTLELIIPVEAGSGKYKQHMITFSTTGTLEQIRGLIDHPNEASNYFRSFISSFCSYYLSMPHNLKNMEKSIVTPRYAALQCLIG